MKKFILKLSFIILLLIIPVNLSANENTKTPLECLQSKVYKAYIYHSGNWHTGKIFINQNENGYRLESYSFSDVFIGNGQRLEGSFIGGEELIRLNPNNELAINNNFTHYVEIMGLNAYIIGN